MGLERETYRAVVKSSIDYAGLAQTVKFSLPNSFLFQIWQEQELPERREDPGVGEKERSSSSHRLPGINSLVVFFSKERDFRPIG